MARSMLSFWFYSACYATCELFSHKYPCVTVFLFYKAKMYGGLSLKCLVCVSVEEGVFSG